MSCNITYASKSVSAMLSGKPSSYETIAMFQFLIKVLSKNITAHLRQSRYNCVLFQASLGFCVPAIGRKVTRDDSLYGITHVRHGALGAEKQT